MSKEGVDLGRRRFLTATASVVGGVGATAAAIPFVTYMLPSARAKAAGAPIEVDISKLEAGQLMKVKWRGKVVWVLRRTEEMLADLDTFDKDELRDPDSKEIGQQPQYATNKVRSIKPEYFIAVGLCTHLGCSPKEAFKGQTTFDLGANWNGGFFCPCHGSKFDLAGRVYSGVPAPLNLYIPPHRYLSNTVVLIGDDIGAA